MKGFIGGSEVTDRLLDPDTKDEWVRSFRDHAFDRLPERKGIGIVPFSPSQLGPVSYDLTVGKQVQPLRRADKIEFTPESDSIKIDPGETVLVLTREFLALSPSFGAITLSRARIMNEGIALSSAKIDPTWYGCLVIPITNNSRRQFTLRQGDRFCTILVFELDVPIEIAQYLTRENTPHLGQATFQYEPRHAVPWEPKRPEAVRAEDMDEAVAFGPPFDIVRGMFDRNRRDIVDYMEKQWGTKALRELKHSVWEEEFQQIKQYRTEEIGLLKQQIDILRTHGRWQLTLTVTLILAVLTWIAATVVQFMRTGVPPSGG